MSYIVVVYALTHWLHTRFADSESSLTFSLVSRNSDSVTVHVSSDSLALPFRRVLRLTLSLGEEGKLLVAHLRRCSQVRPLSSPTVTESLLAVYAVVHTDHPAQLAILRLSFQSGGLTPTALVDSQTATAPLLSVRGSILDCPICNATYTFIQHYSI